MGKEKHLLFMKGLWIGFIFVEISKVFYKFKIIIIFSYIMKGF